MVDLVPCYADRNLYLRMAKDYINTLKQYDGEIVWDERAFLDKLWDACFIMEDRTIQGFVVSTTIKFEVFPDAMYIEETYVVPEARKKGYGKAAVMNLMKNYDGDVFLYVLDQNFEARLFWEVIEADLGWKRIERPEIRNEPGCELRVYSVK